MKPHDWEAFKYWGVVPPSQPERTMIRPLGVPTSSLIDKPTPAHLRAEPERSEGASPLGARYFHPARRARRWWPWVLALVVLVALAVLSSIASAQLWWNW